MPFGELQEILNLTIGWEKKIKDLYDVAEIGLKDEKSKKIVTTLREKLLKTLKILEGINVEDYGTTEWIRYPPEYKDEDLIPIRKIKKFSSPKEIFEQILEYEEKLQKFYSSIRDMLISRGQRELFDSLDRFTISQIIEIKKFMDVYDLVV